MLVAYQFTIPVYFITLTYTFRLIEHVDELILIHLVSLLA